MSETRYVTPTGVASYVNVRKPISEKAKFNGGYFTCDIYVEKSEANKSKLFKKLIAACNDLLAEKKAKSKSLKKLKNFAITNTEDLDDNVLSYLPEEMREGWIRIRAKQKQETDFGTKSIQIVDEDREVLDFETAKLLQNGSLVRMSLVPWFSDNYGETISFSLRAVQLIEEDAGYEFPEGRDEELEQEKDVDVFAEADKVSKKTKSKKVEEEEDDEDEEEEEEQPKPKKKAKKKAKKKEVVEEEEDDEDEDADDLF